MNYINIILSKACSLLNFKETQTTELEGRLYWNLRLNIDIYKAQSRTDPIYMGFSMPASVLV